MKKSNIIAIECRLLSFSENCRVFTEYFEYPDATPLILSKEEWDHELKDSLTCIGKSLESKVEFLKSLDEKVIVKIDIDAIETEIVQ